MYVEYINVGCLKLLKGCLIRETKGFGPIAAKIDLNLPPLVTWKRSRVFSRKHNLVSILTGCHPFTKPDLRFLALVSVGSVDEVAALVEVMVKDLEGILLAAITHMVLLRFTKIHSAQT